MDVPHITYRSITHYWPSNGGGNSHRVTEKDRCMICKEEAEAKKKRIKK